MSVPARRSVTGGGNVYTSTKLTASDSTTKVTLVTPTSGKKIRVISIHCSSSSATASVFEAYFHTGANIDATANNAVFSTYLDTDIQPADGMVWPNGVGPLGAVDEVVSMRTGTNISAAGRFTIVYGEE